MARTAYINARVESKLKKEAERVFERVGVKTSDALTMFLHQVVMHEGMPFEVRIPNKESSQTIADLRAGKGKVYAGSTKDIFDSILKEG